MNGSPPLLQAGRLWETTSGKGTRYMQGRLGGVKLVILPNRDYVAGDPANGHTYQGGAPAYRTRCEEVAASDYAGIKLSSG